MIRHNFYGLQHLRWVMDHDPGRKEELHKALDEAETFTIQQFDAALTECMIVEGTKIVGNLQVMQIEEYFDRLRRAAFEERVERSKFGPMLADMGLA